MGDRLAQYGWSNMSAAVRPMALSPDERFVYFQLSFPHGFVEYDLKLDRPLRIASLPLSGEDRVAVISYRRQREIAGIAVGDHPQRMRMGAIRRAYLR
jgi:hypothetical protein